MGIPNAGKAGNCQPVRQWGQGSWFVEHSSASASAGYVHEPDVTLCLHPSHTLDAHLGEDPVICRTPHLCPRKIRVPLSQWMRTFCPLSCIDLNLHSLMLYLQWEGEQGVMCGSTWKGKEPSKYCLYTVVSPPHPGIYLCLFVRNQLLL